MRAWNRRPKEDVETERARLMARADAAGHEAMVRRVQRNATQEERAEARRLRRAERRQRQSDRTRLIRTAVEAVRQRLILVLPLIGVNVLALAGQVGFATTHFGWALAPAIFFGCVLESIALYIGWHAHQALLAGDSASKLRASSYLMGAIVGGLNYDHFAGADWSPTAKSVVFGMLSLTSPWLWAMHGRYANRKRLRELGLVDERAPHFAGGRWVHFPVQTWCALRWGIANNVQDPARAWDGYQNARRFRQAIKDERPVVRVTVARIQNYTLPGRTGLFWVKELSPLSLVPSARGPHQLDGPRPEVAPGRTGGATRTQGHDHGQMASGATSERATSGSRVRDTSGPQSHHVAPTRGATSATPPDRGPTTTANVAPATERSTVVDFVPRGEVQADMRTHWDARIAVGQIPTGADLNRAVGKDPKYSLGKRYAKDWRRQLSAAFVEAVDDGRPDDAAQIARESTAGLGKEVGS